MLEELGTETEPRGVMYDEDGDGERKSVAQGLGASIGGGAAGLPFRREDMEGTERREELPLVRLAMDGRLSWLWGSLAIACRIALP